MVTKHGFGPIWTDGWLEGLSASKASQGSGFTLILECLLLVGGGQEVVERFANQKWIECTQSLELSSPPFISASNQTQRHHSDPATKFHSSQPPNPCHMPHNAVYFGQPPYYK